MLSINLKFLTVKYPVLHEHSSLPSTNTLKYSQGITRLPPEPPNWPPHFYSLPLPLNPFTNCQNDLFECRFVHVCTSPPATLKILQWLSSALTIKCKLFFLWGINHNWTSTYLPSCSHHINTYGNGPINIFAGAPFFVGQLTFYPLLTRLSANPFKTELYVASFGKPTPFA